MNNAVKTILAVADIGGQLSVVDGDRLRVALPVDCPPELKDAIRTNKPGLLALLAGPPFVIVRSEVLANEMIIWTANEQGREHLITHGAPPGLIYIRDELAALVERNTVPAALVTLHRAKRLFNGRLFTQ